MIIIIIIINECIIHGSHILIISDESHARQSSSPRIFGNLRRNFSGKIALLFRIYSQEKFRTFLADNFINITRNVQFQNFCYSGKRFNNNPGVIGEWRWSQVSNLLADFMQTTSRTCSEKQTRLNDVIVNLCSTCD